MQLEKIQQLLLTVAFLVPGVVDKSLWAQPVATPLGIFEAHEDIGAVLHGGAAGYDEAKRSYTLTGGGENIWSTSDHFQFAWKKVSGDVSLTAEISFLTATGNEHRKAVLMIRQSLDADIALHGNGLTALQYREKKGAVTQEIQSNLSAPKQLRIEKRGDYFHMWLAGDSREERLAGGSMRIPFHEPFYVGIGVSAHDKEAVEKVVFSNLRLESEPSPVGELKLYSALETVAIASTDRRVVYVAAERFEAPNWTRDGKFFLFNSNGRILRLPVTGGKPEVVDTGFADRCNNDHGLSPDGTLLAISDQSQDDRGSRVYVVSANGGTPKRITKNAPSYWHGWSPDGNTLAFVGQRNGEFDIYTIPVTGGEETQLTSAKGLDDGPEYSPDGNYIYFNSERTGGMQLWRMRPDGSEQEQLTADGFNDWFPHVSPDGQWIVFLSYDRSVSGHPESKDVRLRLMSVKEKKISVLATLFGGQGTINVPSWSPDSKQLAFVSYHLVRAH